jgi:hypothetical protein
MEPPRISVGSKAEYAYWLARLRGSLAEDGGRADNIEQVDARYNYRDHRITLYHLSDPTDPLSVAETLSHEYLHALLDGLGEPWAARELDLVARPVRGGTRLGGI